MRPRSPRVGIGMPVFNCERFLEQSLNSLCAQTFGDFELVISDNASTDKTEQICRDFAAKDKRIRYFRNETNIGGPRNFNRVFHLCHSEYHKWSTADDYCDITLLEKCVRVLDGDPEVVLCYPKTTLIDEHNVAIEQYEDNLHLQEASPSKRFIQLFNTIGLCQAHLGLIRREVLSRTALMGNQLGSDVHLLAELTLHGKFFLIPEFLFFRRHHTGSSSWERSNIHRYHNDLSSWERQNMQRQELYYDPGHETHLFGMHTFKKYIKLITAVHRAPISVAEKLKLFRRLGRGMRWDRVSLGRELLQVLRGI